MKQENHFVYYRVEPNMKTSQMSSRIVCFSICIILLIVFAVREVADTERGELLAHRLAIKLNPNDIEAHQYLANHHIERREYTEAAREIDIILRLSPGLDLSRVIDTWGKLPEAARLAIQANVRTSPATRN